MNTFEWILVRCTRHNRCGVVYWTYTLDSLIARYTSHARYESTKFTFLLHVTHLLTRRLLPTSQTFDRFSFLLLPLNVNFGPLCFEKLSGMLHDMLRFEIEMKYLHLEMRWYAKSDNLWPTGTETVCVTTLLPYWSAYSVHANCEPIECHVQYVYTHQPHNSMYVCRNGRPEFVLFFFFFVSRYYRIYFLLFAVCALTYARKIVSNVEFDVHYTRTEGTADNQRKYQICARTHTHGNRNPYNHERRSRYIYWYEWIEPNWICAMCAESSIIHFVLVWFVCWGCLWIAGAQNSKIFINK